MAHIQCMNRRTDRSTALLIDAYVDAAATLGAVNAARELSDYGIDRARAVRVLTRTAERRAYPEPVVE